MAVTEDHQLVGMELEVRLAERLLGAAIEHLEPDDVALRDACAVWVSFDRVAIGRAREDVVGGAG
jgi:hypothetical protein